MTFSLPLDRARIATIITWAVLLLLVTSGLSLGQSCVQLPDAQSYNHRADPELQNVSGLQERIREVLTVVPISKGCERQRIISIVGTTVSKTWWMASPLSTATGLLAAAAVLFAGFGLVVLCWGRDRPSFWLGASLATLAPGFLPFYGFVPEVLSLALVLVANALTVFGIYAFFMMAHTVIEDCIAAGGRIRPVLRAVRACVIVALTLTASASVASLLARVSGDGGWTWLSDLDRVGTDLSWDIVFCTLPLVYLVLAATRAITDALLVRARVILLITALGLSGTVYSLARQHGFPAEAPFDLWWFTLLAVPIGFIIGMLTYRVFDFKFILTRLLVSTILAGSIYLAFYFSELRIKPLALGFVKVDPSQRYFGLVANLLVSFVVANSFGRAKKALHAAFRRIMFKQRDQGILALKSFAARDPAGKGEDAIIVESSVSVLSNSLRTRGAAMYEAVGDTYALREHCGENPWPAEIRRDDPLFAALDKSDVPVALTATTLAASVLWNEGTAYEVTAGGRRIGVLALRPHANEGDGDFDEDELSAVAAVVRVLGEARLSTGLREFGNLLEGLSTGAIHDSEARQRALELQKYPFLKAVQ